MGKHVSCLFKRGQQGFTLIELMAVMGILAILVAVVAPAAMNSERAGIKAQAMADSQQVRTAATEFFTRNNEADVRTPHTVTVTTTVNGVALPAATQKVSSRWPEMFITAGSGVPTLPNRTASAQHSGIFETVTDPRVLNVVLLAKDGITPISGSDFLTKFTSIDALALVNSGLMKRLPDGVLKTSSTGVGTGVNELKVPNILWLFKRQNSGLGTDDDRVVFVFTLVKVEKIEPPPSTTGGGATSVNITYQQIVGS